jgi:hypothetical protein
LVEVSAEKWRDLVECCSIRPETVHCKRIAVQRIYATLLLRASLVEAYDLLKSIYLERGYRQRDIPELILTKNLYGLDICPRAAQLACFSLLMKGREDDRRLLKRGIQPQLESLSETMMARVPQLDKDNKRGPGHWASAYRKH